MDFLNRARTGIGPLRPKRKLQFMAYFTSPEPDPEEFEDLAGVYLVVAGKPEMTVREAIEAIEPGFTASGRVADGFTMARAMKLALAA